MKSKYIPNIITSTNLIAGVMSLVFVMAGNNSAAAAMVLLATLMDSMDGRVARSLNASSNFGKELDSLSDLVSFGVAPAILAYSMKLENIGLIGLVGAVIFVVCGALRLARFNTTTFTGNFQGVPITVAGGLVALILLVGKGINETLLLAIVITLAALMVSKVSLPKF